MGFNSLTYSLVMKYFRDKNLGILRIDIPESRDKIIFTRLDGIKIEISSDDWYAITEEEKEKLAIIITGGSGNLFYFNDGIYRNVIADRKDKYDETINTPQINGIFLLGDMDAVSELKYSRVSMDGEYCSLNGLPTIPHSISGYINNLHLITVKSDNLTNYYPIGAVYSQEELDRLAESNPTLKVSVVDTLPPEGEEKVVYLIKVSGSEFYDQWLFNEGQWRNIGTTEIDITTDYYTKGEIDIFLNEKVNLRAGYRLTQENFTSEDKTTLKKLNKYILPKATTDEIGGVKVDGKSIIVKDSKIMTPYGAGGLEPLSVKDLEVIPSDKSLIIKWKDPSDIIDDSGTVLSKWKGTLLVLNASKYPSNFTDGIIEVDNTIRNQYSYNGFVIDGLTNGVTYYLQLFPYSETFTYNQKEANRFKGIPQNSQSTYKVMTVIIDTTNSNPETALTYKDDALAMTPGSNEWDVWFGEYPCLFKNGAEVSKINPDNFDQSLAGSAIDINSGNTGDVMIAYPRKGVKIETNNGFITVSMTDNPNDPSFKYYAHQRGSEDREVFYLGAFKGFVDSDNKLRSIADKIPNVNFNFSQSRSHAQNNGIGYEQSGYYQLLFRQAMYTLKYKNLNSQIAVGLGYTGGNGVQSTGNTISNGMNYGTNLNDSRVKLFGIEDFWGNTSEYIDGYMVSSDFSILTATDNFNDTGIGYVNHGRIVTTDYQNYMKYVAGTSEAGFSIKEAGGSETTYWCDYATIHSNCISRYGGTWLSRMMTGVFFMMSDITTTTVDGTTSARLMYL